MNRLVWFPSKIVWKNYADAWNEEPYFHATSSTRHSSLQSPQHCSCDLGARGICFFQHRLLGQGDGLHDPAGYHDDTQSGHASA